MWWRGSSGKRRDMKTVRKIGRARQLRRSLSLPEAKLWTLLRTRPDGFKFRRQHPVGPYIVDFYCPEARLAIEVDGASHAPAPNRSGIRHAMSG